MYYYKNRRKGSKENRSAKKLYQEFLELLASNQLKDKKYVAPLKELVYDTFVKVNEEGIKESERLNKEILGIENKPDRLEERYVFEKINKAQYNKFKAKLTAEIKGKRENLSNHSFDSSNLKK